MDDDKVSSLVDQMAPLVAAQMKAWKKNDKIIENLEKTGYPRELAESLVLHMRPIFNEAMLERGQRNINIGGAVFGIGLIVTLGSMFLLDSHFFLAWGALLFGLVQLIGGVVEKRRAQGNYGA